MKYTEKMRVDGELAVRRLSEEAAKYYNGTDPLTVFAYENDDGETRYSYSYSTNPYADRYKSENLTFEELQEAFEEAQKEIDKQLEADGEPDLKPRAEFSTDYKIREITALVGEENLDDFRISVEKEFGSPDVWDLSDENFMNKARLCAMWNLDKTVIRARYIAAVMELELYKDRNGIDIYGQGENVITEFPEWEHYDTPDTMRHYAGKIVNEYEQGYIEYLTENGIIPEQLKSDVVAIYREDFFENRSEFIAITRGDDGKFYNKYGYDIKEGTSNTYYIPKGFDNLNDARNSVHDAYRNLTLLYEDVTKTGDWRSGVRGRKYYNFADAIKASKKIAGDVLYLRKSRYKDVGDSIISDINSMDSHINLKEGGNVYWVVDHLGSIGYTENNGKVVHWDFQALEVHEPEKQSEPTNVSTPQAAGKNEVDHMKYNGGTKRAGEAACRQLSKKAAEYYNAHRLSVFEYNNENGEKRYAYSSDSYVNAKAEDLTFEELQAALEEMQSRADEMLEAENEFNEPEQVEQPDKFLTGDYVRTPRGSFHLTALSREQMQAAGYGLHHESEDGKYYIMGNGTEAFAVAKQSEKQPESKELIALLTVKQCGFTKYFNMGDASMDDIFRQLKKAANPFIETKGEVISDEGRFAELEQSGKVSVSVTADIDNDSIIVYEINGVSEEKRTDENTRIWHRSKMSNFLKDRVREPKTDNSQHSPYHGVGRSHVSEHEREM